MTPSEKIIFFQVILLHKVKSAEDLKDKQNEEIDKERILMEDAIGFSNFINFLSQTVSIIFCCE